MYRVLLVDDEPWILVGIRKSFKWNEMGFEVIAETDNPVEALEIIIAEKPDVIFTDIRMPEISGLDLIKKCKENGIDSEFIIISGFAEFEYAKEALKLGAFDYLLKPIQIDETDEMLKKLFLHLGEKRHFRDLEIFDMIMENRFSINNIIKRLPADKSYQVFTAVSDSDIKTDRICFPIKDIKLELKLGMGKSLYIISNPNSFIKNGLPENIIKDGICNTYIGISSISDKLEDIPRLVKEADIAVYNYFLNDSQRIFPYKEANYNLIKDIIKKIIVLVNTCSRDEIKDFFETFPEQFIEHKLGMSEIVFLWNKLCSYIIEKYEIKAAHMEFEFMDHEQIKSRFKNFKRLCEYLTASFLSLCELNYLQKSETDVNSNFMELLEYLNGNFQKEQHLMELSKKYFINLTYCCDLFRKVTGSTFSEYVAKLRMNKACELLMESRLTIDEICKEVGYNDYYYFNKLFKKYKGASPAKFRKIPGYS